jgi:TP901 family phage tail tape measure protein
MNILKETMNGVFEQIGTKLLPVLTRIVEYITPIVEKIGNWVSANPELTATVLAIATAITGAIAALSAIGLILPAVITGF